MEESGNGLIKILPHLLGDIEENHEKPKSG
jgi:hypothetical protein